MPEKRHDIDYASLEHVFEISSLDVNEFMRVMKEQLSLDVGVLRKDLLVAGQSCDVYLRNYERPCKLYDKRGLYLF